MQAGVFACVLVLPADYAASLFGLNLDNAMLNEIQWTCGARMFSL